jgi:hypothetical protein
MGAEELLLIEHHGEKSPEPSLIDERDQPASLRALGRQVGKRTRRVREDVRAHHGRRAIGLREQPQHERVALDHIWLEHGRCAQRQQTDE